MAHFLLVDDHEATLDVMQRVLAWHEHTSDLAKDGLEAEQRVIDTGYDAVITNQDMPRCNGTEFLQRVRPRLEGRVPCAVETGYTTPEMSAAAADAGALWILELPLDIEALLRVVSQMLTVRRAWTAPHELTLDDVREEPNAEVRRILRECYGESRFLTETGVTLVHVDTVPVDRLAPTGRSITRALVQDADGRRFLVASDGSTRRVYYMEVPRTCVTCRDAYVALSGRPDVRTIVEA